MHIENVRRAHLDAMMDATRRAWLLNFEALASVPPKADALAKTPQ